MKPGPVFRKSFASGNFFRAEWMYRRLPQGDAMLDAGRGMSPAFFALLRLIERDQPVSFGELGQSLGWLHADDLELWLAELCRMGLIAPAGEAAAEEAVQSESGVVGLVGAAPAAAALTAPADTLDFVGGPWDAAPCNAALCDCAPAAHSAPVSDCALDFVGGPWDSGPSDSAPAAHSAPVSVCAPAVAAIPAAALAPIPATVFAFTPAAAPREAVSGVDWRRVSLDALYVELMNICDELQVREGQVPEAMAA